MNEYDDRDARPDVLARVTAIERDLIGLDRRMLETFVSRDHALEVARVAIDKRLDDMNKFREAMNDAQRDFITRPEHETVAIQINDLRLAMRGIANEYVPKIDMGQQSTRLAAVEKSMSDLHTRYAMVALMFSTGVVIANLVLVFWSHIHG
jgi:hypothetical protein